MIGQKGSGSSLVSIGVLLSFALVFIFKSAIAGLVIGVLITVGLMCYSNTVYNETPEMIQRNRTRKEKIELTKNCLTPDAASDKLFADKVIRAANGYARKKHLSKPNGECYKLAMMSYTKAIMYSSEHGYPESLKNKGIYACYYKPIIRMVGMFDDIKVPVRLGRIFVYGIDDKTIYEINVPNYVDWLQFEKNKHYGFTIDELQKTKLSDPRLTMEDILNM